MGEKNNEYMSNFIFFFEEKKSKTYVSER